MSDKAKHFLACLLIAFWVGLFFGAWWGIVASVAAGVGKEAYDSRPGGTGWDWWDIAADGVGTSVGSLLLLGMKHIAGV